MPYLRLIDSVTQDVTEIRDAVARLGRSPDCRVVVGGPGAGVVSALHAELRYEDGAWCLADLRSRNGTYLNDRRLDAAVIVGPGDVIGLGESGPRFEITAVTEGAPLPPTLPERPGLPAGDRAYGITLLDSATGRRYEAAGVRIRIGRGRECEVQVAAGADTTVSRVHAELIVDPSGSLLVRDAGSRNGTWVNGERVITPLPVRLGDRIMLGAGGPLLVVDGLGTMPQLPVARPAARQAAGRPSVARVIGHALAQAKQARREGKRGSGAAFVRTVAAEGSPRWLVGVVMVLFLLLAGRRRVRRVLAALFTSRADERGAAQRRGFGAPGDAASRAGLGGRPGELRAGGPGGDPARAARGRPGPHGGVARGAGPGAGGPRRPARGGRGASSRGAERGATAAGGARCGGATRAVRRHAR